jgi:excisionase family DNA binding protein
MSKRSQTRPRVLTVDEAAATLRCSRATLYSLIRRRELRAFRLGPRGSLRLRVDAVERWMEEQERDT